MPAYRVSGHFTMGWQDRQKFSIEVVAADEAAAKELVTSSLGSRHGVPRRQVAIASAEPIPAGDVEDPVVRYKLKNASSA